MLYCCSCLCTPPPTPHMRLNKFIVWIIIFQVRCCISCSFLGRPFQWAAHTPCVILTCSQESKATLQKRASSPNHVDCFIKFQSFSACVASKMELGNTFSFLCSHEQASVYSSIALLLLVMYTDLSHFQDLYTTNCAYDVRPHLSVGLHTWQTC